MNFLNVYINNLPFQIKSNLSILEGCNLSGFEISRFCFHEKLFVAGNCRMCLVEIKGQAKLSASCAVFFFGKNVRLYKESNYKKSKRKYTRVFINESPIRLPYLRSSWRV